MMNALWVAMILVALLAGALNGALDKVAKAVTDSAGTAVTLAIGLVGTMALWLGLMRVLQQAGALRMLAKLMRPLLRRLFPEVPEGHPALSMMVLNIASTMFGLGNAATPFGLKAMTELDTLNPHKGTATNAMALFLAINTAGFTLMPTTVIALRSSLGSSAPGSIFLTTLIASSCSTIAAIIVCKLAERFFSKRVEAGPDAVVIPAPVSDDALNEARALTDGIATSPSTPRVVIACVTAVAVVSAMAYHLIQRASTLGATAAVREAFAQWPLVVILGAVVLYGLGRGVKVYDCVVEGGKEAFAIALKIIPFLVAMLVAIGMLRASGAIDLLVHTLAPVTGLVGMPAEALPMALLRPFSGSGSLALMTETMKTHGADSLIGNIVSTMYGGSETTFYVLAVYFGAVGIRTARHTIIPCLAVDIVGALTSVWAARLLLGG